MHIEPFVMERWQSTYENEVSFNLSESGVHPLRVGDLLDESAALALISRELGYPQTNGTRELREAIASLYRGATAEHVQVTNGGAEANFVALWRTLEPGDEVVLMVPNYMQARGLACAFAGTVHDWPLQPAADGTRWEVDLEALARLTSPRTRIIAICNPNNPTGARFGAGTLDDIARIAGRHGAWVLSDEIYAGAEIDGDQTPSMWDRYERVIVTAGLSKAYGLPGLRIGWIVAAPDVVEQTWMYHDYTTIAPGALNDWLARLALAPSMRPRILERTRAILRENLPLVTRWLADRQDIFSFVPPEAGAIVYPRYHLAVNSTELVSRLRDEESTLVVPGDHFGMDGYLRVGYGSEGPHLMEGLGRLDKVLRRVRA